MTLPPEMAGPTIEDVTNAVCPDSQPYKCLPHGSCYGPDSYCDPNFQSVESCFPPNLVTNESKLAFCQDIHQNVSKLLHPTCQFACMTLPPEMAGPTIKDVTNAVCPDSQPYKCLPYGSCYGPDSYCDPNSQSVESCFPHNLVTLESKLAYCQDVHQNISKLRHPICQHACKILLPEKPDSESHSGVWKWLYAAIAVIIGLVCVIIWQNKEKIYKRVTFKCLKYQARADDPASAAKKDERTEMLSLIYTVAGVQEADTDVREGTQTISQIQNQLQQQNQTQQPLENTNGRPQVQQLSLTNSVDEVPRSCPSSGNDSAMSSPASSLPSASSVSTNDDSGVSSGRDGLIEHTSLVQQTSQSQVLMNQNGDFNQQSSGEHRADVHFSANASISDQESRVVTSLSAHRD